MFEEIANVYDNFKKHRDYTAEAEQIVAIINSASDKKESILNRRIVDLGCATGSLLLACSEYGSDLCRIDGSQNMIEVARKKLPNSVELKVASFEDFAIDSLAGVLLWMDGAIGYVDPDRLDATVENIGRNLLPDGLVLIEPWYSPENWSYGREFIVEYQDDQGVHYKRTSTGRLNGRVDFIHEIIDEHETCVIEGHTDFTLHRLKDIVNVFQRNNFSIVKINRGALFKRGLLVAKKECK